jgi:hypothetical protein
MKKMSFEDMSKINPTLALLERLCELVHTDTQNRLYRYWYETIKPVMARNVGTASAYPELQDSATYRRAYEHLCSKLGMEE